MDKLLPRIKAFCQQNLSWVRRSDVTLIPNPGVIPEWVGFPYIGLKDGNVSIHHEVMGGGQGTDLLVEVYIYDTLGRNEDKLLGLHVKARDISERLTGYTFPDGIISAVPTTQIPVALLYTKKGLVIRKGLRFQYEREE